MASLAERVLCQHSHDANPTSASLDAASFSCCCCNQGLHTERLKTSPIYHLRILKLGVWNESRRWRPRCQQACVSLEALGKNLLLALSSCRRRVLLWACDPCKVPYFGFGFWPWPSGSDPGTSISSRISSFSQILHLNTSVKTLGYLVT